MGTKDDDEAAKVAAEIAAAKKISKVKRIQFISTFYEAGRPKYEAGKHYPSTAETESQVEAGNAKLVTVEVDTADHEAESAAAVAALKSARKQTLDAEADARARGQLKD